MNITQHTATTLNKYIYKNNALIEAQYSFTTWEYRIFELCIAYTDTNATELKLHRFYLAELVKLFGVSKSAYPLIRKAVESLKKKEIRVPFITPEGYERYADFNVTSVSTEPKKYNEIDDNDYIEIKLSSDLKPFIYERKSYCKYPIEALLCGSSPYSFRIYLFLKRYEFKGRRAMDVENMKFKMMLQDRYKLYGNFKRKVLLQAQKDLLERSDICFTLREKKKGKKVVTIIFDIEKNKPHWMQAIEQQEQANQLLTDDILQTQAYQMLFEQGVKKHELIVELIEQFGNDFIVATIEQCALVIKKEKDKIQNPSGYIIEAIRKGYHKAAIEEAKQQQEAEEQRKQSELEAAQRAADEETAKEQFYIERKQAVEAHLANLPQAQVEQLKQDFIASKAANHLTKKMIESRGFSHPMIEAWRHQTIAEQFLEDRYKGFEVKSKKDSIHGTF